MSIGKIAGVVVGTVAIVVGGYYLTKKLMSSPWITLEKADEVEYKGEDNKSKFGYQFKKWMVSTTKSENDKFWEQKIKKISELGTDQTLSTEGYLNEVTEKAKAWKDKTTNKETKMTEAINKLKEKCKAKYDTTQANEEYAEADKAKWTEIWKYCSADEEGMGNMKFKAVS